jgi:hypothetical protein
MKGQLGIVERKKVVNNSVNFRKKTFCLIRVRVEKNFCFCYWSGSGELQLVRIQTFFREEQQGGRSPQS